MTISRREDYSTERKKNLVERDFIAQKEMIILNVGKLVWPTFILLLGDIK